MQNFSLICHSDMPPFQLPRQLYSSLIFSWIETKLFEIRSCNRDKGEKGKINFALESVNFLARHSPNRMDFPLETKVIKPKNKSWLNKVNVRKCDVNVWYKTCLKHKRQLTSESAPLSAPGHLNVTYSWHLLCTTNEQTVEGTKEIKRDGNWIKDQIPFLTASPKLNSIQGFFGL